MIESLTRQLSSSGNDLRQVLDKPQRPLNLIPDELALIRLCDRAILTTALKLIKSLSGSSYRLLN